MPSPWLIGAGLSAASQFIPRRRKTTRARRVRKNSTRIPKAVRATYLRARMNKNPALAKQAQAYRSAYKQQYKKQSKTIDLGLTRQYAYKKTRLTRNIINPRLLVPYTVDRLQGIQREQPNQDPDAVLNYFPGFYTIQKGASTSYSTPVVFFDLTRFGNTATATSVAKQLRINATGDYVFDDKFSQNATAATVASQYITENSTYGANLNPSVAKIQAAWYDIRLKLYGARKQAVTYDVMLVRFKRAEMIPENEIVTTTAIASKAKLFYQELVRQYTVNSIFKASNTWKNHVDIIKSQRIKLPPSDADDLDRNPESVDLKWFIRDMRIRSYQESVATLLSNTAVDSVAFPTQNQTVVRNDPYPTSRMYLMVCATDMTSSLGTDDMDDSPSFDASIRRKLYFYGPSV